MMAKWVFCLVQQQFGVPFYDTEVTTDILRVAEATERFFDLYELDEDGSETLSGEERELIWLVASMLTALMRLIRVKYADAATEQPRLALLRRHTARIESVLTRWRHATPAEPVGQHRSGDLLAVLYNAVPGVALRCVAAKHARPLCDVALRLFAMTAQQLQSAAFDHARAEAVLNFAGDLSDWLRTHRRPMSLGRKKPVSKERRLAINAALLCKNLLALMRESLTRSAYHLAWDASLKRSYLTLESMIYHLHSSALWHERFFQHDVPARSVQLAQFARANSGFCVLPEHPSSDMRFVYGSHLLILLAADGRRRDIDLIHLIDPDCRPHPAHAARLLDSSTELAVWYVDRAERPSELFYNPDTLAYECRPIALQS